MNNEKKKYRDMMRLQNMPTTCKKFDDQRHINLKNN